MFFSRNSCANLASQPSYKLSTTYGTFLMAFFWGLASIVLSTQVFFLGSNWPRLFERRTFAAEVLLQKKYRGKNSAEVLLEKFFGEHLLQKFFLVKKY